MKMICFKCGAELNDDVWELYEYEDNVYCSDCLIKQLVEDGIVNKIIVSNKE